eukprot:m.155751 g.155751  ORF g.155751 m.155751 type:complete len:384 (+) comp14418_c0_seq2:249-1400(+)
MGRPGGGRGAGPAVTAESEKKKLFHRFKRVKQALVSAKKGEVKQCNRGIKRLEAKATQSDLNAATQAQLEKLQTRNAWLRGLDGDALLKLCGFNVDVALATPADVALRTVRIADSLDSRQRGVIQKLVQTQEVADRLLELKEGRTSEPSKADRKRKRAAEDASGQVDVPSDGVAADSEEPPNPYAHWAVATEEEGAFMDDGDVSDFGDGEDGSHLGTVSHEADDSRVNSVEEDDSGMFLSSLSAGGDKAMKAVKREVFVGVDRNAAPTIIGQKKKKNRAGQMARQKRAALKFGEEAKHVRDPSRDANAKQEARRQQKEKKNAKGRKKPREGQKEGPDPPKKPQTPVKVAGAMDEEDMHPSWVAKKQEKSAAIQPFQGKKITFD